MASVRPLACSGFRSAGGEDCFQVLAVRIELADHFRQAAEAVKGVEMDVEPALLVRCQAADDRHLVGIEADDPAQSGGGPGADPDLKRPLGGRFAGIVLAVQGSDCTSPACKGGGGGNWPPSIPAATCRITRPSAPSTATSTSVGCETVNVISVLSPAFFTAGLAVNDTSPAHAAAENRTAATTINILTRILISFVPFLIASHDLPPR